MNRSEIYPELRGFGSNGTKLGKVLPFYILGTRRPSKDY
jgi:hypothetical protein